MVTDEELLAARDPKKLPLWTQDDATPNQVGYITGLVRSREVPEAWLLEIKELVEKGLKKGDAGNIISKLKPLPVKPGQDDPGKNKPTIKDLPPGRYALRLGDDENDISFFRAKDVRGGPEKEGGYRLLLRIVGPSAYALQRGETQEIVKKIIRAGVGDSAALYGFKIGRCSKCHTRITNRVSRELGIGPICGGRYYEDWETRVHNARTAIQARGQDPDENVPEEDGGTAPLDRQ